MHSTRAISFEEALAHQLRTPISALKASATNMRRTIRCLLEDLASIGQPSGAARLPAFLARVIDEPCPPAITGLLPADRLEVIARRLRATGLKGDVASIASSLVRGGWDTYMDEIAPMIEADPGTALNVLDAGARLRASLASIEASLARMEGVSGALRLLTAEFEAVPLDLVAALEETADYLRASADGARRIRVKAGVVPPVLAHSGLLREVWSALLTNALQSIGPDGHVLIEAESAHGGGAVVRIIDDGPGIAPENLERIFEPGFSTRSAEGGSGLGLPLARRIVARMGGTLAVRSQPGETCFTVGLPAGRAAASAGGE